MKTKSISTEMAETLLALPTTEFSPAARQAALVMILDTLGCACGGMNAPGVAQLTDQLKRWGGQGQASLLYDGTRLPSAHAALANSVAIHALDLDDIYMPGILHLSSVLVPAVLASAEETGASGTETLAALITGTEAAARVGIAFLAFRRGEGFLPTTLAAGFGAVVAASRLKGLSPETCAHAMGLHYAQLGGNRQALFEAALAKRMQPGFCVRSALHSVEMAECGLTGPAAVFEGAAGLFAIYGTGGQAPREALLPQGETFEIERVAYKRYPSCGACHNVQIAAERLHDAHTPQPGDIAAVHLFGCGPGGIVGHPFKLGDQPQVSVQFSAAWAVAYALLRGHATLDAYTNERILQDTEVLELARRIDYVERPDDLPPKPERPAGYYPNSNRYDGVIVKLKNGQTVRDIQSPCHTFTPGGFGLDAMRTKFKDCLSFGRGIEAGSADQAADTILNLEEAPDFRDFLRSFLQLTTSPRNRHASV